MGLGQPLGPARGHRVIAWVLVLLAGCTSPEHASESAAVAPGIELPTASVVASAEGRAAAFDGVVQAVRQTTVAAQVSGAIVALNVKAGDAVKAGQVLLRIDSRSAEHAAAASAAQVRAAQAVEEAATRDYERQQKLFAKRYISQAALDRAEEQYRSALAHAAAQSATALAARTETDFYTVRAPYAGIVSDVPVVLGDMAMPGKMLLTLYDPGVMRVSVAAPHTVANHLANERTAQIELPDVVAGTIVPVATEVLPSVDPTSHTQELRLTLPSALSGVRPGTFARVWLPAATDGQRLYVPVSAVARRGEMAAVYVLRDGGGPILRQVRLGPTTGDRIEVLAGVSAGERVALDPQIAAALATRPRT